MNAFRCHPCVIFCVLCAYVYQRLYQVQRSHYNITCSWKRLISRSLVSYSMQTWRRRFAGEQRQCQTWRRKEDEWSESKGDERVCWCQMGCGSESFTNCCLLVPQHHNLLLRRHRMAPRREDVMWRKTPRWRSEVMMGKLVGDHWKATGNIQDLLCRVSKRTTRTTLKQQYPLTCH